MHSEQAEGGRWKFSIIGFGEPRAKEEAWGGRGRGHGWTAQEAGGGRLSQELGRPVLLLESPTHPFLLGWALLETLQGKERRRRGRGHRAGDTGRGVPNWQGGFDWSLHLAEDRARERQGWC